MRDLTSSLIGFTWAGSLLALRGAGDLVAALVPGAEADEAQARARTRFDRLSWEVTRSLGELGLEAFQAGDSLQRDAADLLLPGSPWDAGGWLRSAAASSAVAGRTLRFLMPTAKGCGAWVELLNKVEVYRLVKQVAGKIGVPPAGEPFDLQLLVERAYALDDFAALWAVEGLGHDYADHAWTAQGSVPEDGRHDPEGLLTGPAAADLPDQSLTMLHAGIGLAFAQRLLAELPPGEPPERVRATVDRVLGLCRANSRPGYEGAAIESLGLVTRTFHGERTGAVDRALRDSGDEAARGFFWHGVGRALYFLPINFVPAGDTTWRPFEMGLAEAPDPAARANVFAGLGWAFTLVDMRQPELMTELLLGPHGGCLRRETGFANGVASSIVMRTDTTPRSDLVEAFLGHTPPPATAGLWSELVVGPARRALDEVYPRLRRQRRLGEIFRYRPEIGSAGGGAS